MFICMKYVPFLFLDFKGLNNKDGPGPVWESFDKPAQMFIDHIYVFLCIYISAL